MAVNPMQKKARNSFLLGMLVTFIICAIIGIMVYILIVLPENKEKSERGQEVKAFVLNKDIKSGDVITKDMFDEITVYSNTIPRNYINKDGIEEIYLKDKDENYIYTYKEEQADGTTISEMYIEQPSNETNTTYKYLTTLKDNKKKEEKQKVLIEKDDNGKYYKTKLSNEEKEYVEFKNVPVVAKINMAKNTLLTTSYVVAEDESVTDDVRTMEYNMLMLPINVAIGDYVDVRITFPNGQDFIVIAKKEIKNIQGNTVTFEMTEAEILMLNSAVVESYIIKASNIYVAKYVEPGMQEKASNTYTPTPEVIRLINTDSNIVAEAKQELAGKFNVDVRNDMNSSSGQYSEEAKTNVEEGIQKQIENAKKAREEYLKGISAE